MIKRRISIALSLLVIGCATYGRKLDQSKVDQIEKGKTTRQEVLSLIGSPDQMTRDGNGNVTLTYMFVRATAKPASYIPIVGAFAGGANVQNQMVMVTVGPDGVVSDVISTQGANETGYGLSAASKASVPDVQEDKRPR